MVTPESLTKSPNVTLMYSSFPLQKSKKTTYNSSILKGIWSGEYTIKGLDKGIATLKLGDQGNLKSGYIVYNDSRIDIKSFSVIPFTQSNSFTAKMKDSRGIGVTITARIRDYGNKIIGNWKDNLGYTGIFSFSRKI